MKKKTSKIKKKITKKTTKRKVSKAKAKTKSKTKCKIKSSVATSKVKIKRNSGNPHMAEMVAAEKERIRKAKERYESFDKLYGKNSIESFNAYNQWRDLDQGFMDIYKSNVWKGGY